MTDLTKGGNDKLNYNAAGNTYVLEKTVDFAVDGALAQNGVHNLFTIPAKHRVDQVQWEVLTAEGAARNFSIGDGDDADGFIASTTANSLASGCSGLALTEGGPNTITGYSNGKYYSAADTIDIAAVTSGGLTTAKIKVKVKVTDFS